MSNSGAIWFIIFACGAWLAAILGWVLNIVKLITTINDPITNMFIARIVGVVFAPLGAILGYL